MHFVDQNAALLQSISDVEVRLAELKAELSLNQQQLTQQPARGWVSPVHKLPDELLLRSFAFAAPSTPVPNSHAQYYAPWTPVQVCKR